MSFARDFSNSKPNSKKFIVDTHLIQVKHCEFRDNRHCVKHTFVSGVIVCYLYSTRITRYGHISVQEHVHCES